MNIPKINVLITPTFYKDSDKVTYRVDLAGSRSDGGWFGVVVLQYFSKRAGATNYCKHHKLTVRLNVRRA